MELGIYIADTGPLNDKGLFDYYYKKMPLYRQEKIYRIAHQNGKCESLGAGILLELALNDAGIPKAARNMVVSENGKPSLSGNYCVYYNLSHSGGKVMCVVTMHPCGCDVQKVKQELDDKIARRFFTDYEYELCMNNPGLFTRIWSLKESYIKTTGRGLSTPLDSFSLDFNEKMVVTGVTVDGQKREDFSFYELDFDDGYKYAVCVQGAMPEPQVQWIDLRRYLE